MVDSPAAITALAACVDDGAKEVREEVAMSVGRLAAPAGFDLLVRLLDDDEEEVRLKAIEVLDLVYPDRVLSEFLSRAADPNYAERIAVIAALGLYGKDQSVARVLLKITADPDENVRTAAAESLARVGENLEVLIDDVSGRKAGMFRSTARFIYRRLGFEEYMRLLREARTQCGNEQEALNKVNQMILTNEPMRRQFGHIFTMILVAMLGLLAVVGGFLTLILRSVIGTGWLYIAQWPYSGYLLALSLAAFLIRGRPLRGTGFMVGLLKFNLFLAVVTVPIYFVFSKLWLLLSVLTILLLVALVMWFRFNRTFARTRMVTAKAT
jgi:HEAT repeats